MIHFSESVLKLFISLLSYLPPAQIAELYLFTSFVVPLSH